MPPLSYARHTLTEVFQQQRDEYCCALLLRFITNTELSPPFVSLIYFAATLPCCCVYAGRRRFTLLRYGRPSLRQYAARFYFAVDIARYAVSRRRQ